MEEEPSIFDYEGHDPVTEGEAQAAADVAEGRVVPHARVRDWLKSLGTDKPLPTPYSWRK